MRYILALSEEGQASTGEVLSESNLERVVRLPSGEVVALVYEQANYPSHIPLEGIVAAPVGRQWKRLRLWAAGVAAGAAGFGLAEWVWPS